ncbi:ABC transporter ATP-binding protein [Pengzhenrongella frigida]|uniref:ABC transporter ATP-binding protein n=1 Tax=Pengzhenrongella frigida TaxID=1259133 RepID=A0A4Q5N230_9MICO|nr:ABC transporter ATP-binding protein [Cellulomonas sp. HLT2-17]RYV50607.1 ABC transporter ATP-binding protein [Cellulomonas sp. HLT2-17]
MPNTPDDDTSAADPSLPAAVPSGGLSREPAAGVGGTLGGGLDSGLGAGLTATLGQGSGLTAQGVHRSFGSVRALAGVDLEAHAGAVTALVGPNGSGKTTLLLIFAGLLVPDAGQVRVGGVDPVTHHQAARARTGWMPDVFGTWDSLTAREVLLTFAAAYRLTRERAEARTTELLETVHLTEFADLPASVLSRGQKQRLGLARALVHDPDVLLLDEPASGLDPRSRVDLRILLRLLASQGKTVLVSSHVLTELDEMADDAIFLSGGRTVPAGTVATAQAAPRTWRLRALSLAALVGWLTTVGATWLPDDERDPAARGTGPGDPPDGPGGVLLQVDGEAGAATLLRDAVAAGVPITSLAPVGGALEQAYLALEEERR